MVYNHSVLVKGSPKQKDKRGSRGRDSQKTEEVKKIVLEKEQAGSGRGKKCC